MKNNKYMILNRVWRFAALVMMALLMVRAQAQIKIDIIGSGASQIPVAIVPFRDETGLRQQLTPVVAGDLARSGLFKLVDAGGIKPVFEADQIDYAQWRARGADAVLIGSVATRGDRHEIRFRVMDTQRQTQLAGFIYTATAAQLRLTAHKIADVIYEKLIGEPGAFATRIAYVVRRSGKRYELHVSDADGYGPQTILASNEPIISPTWSPDGSRLAYVSFESRKPVVYVQSLSGGGRKAVANFFGSNSAPAWSPDGRRLAVVLSKGGGSQMYLISADGSGQPRQLASSTSIDTEPNFSPDGKSIIFTSDRGGSPQIYRIPASGGSPQRLTYEGTYNVSARHSPDGKGFVFIQRNGRRFNVAVQDFASRQVQVLTDGGVDESPSFAPNGRMILYASEIRGRGILAAVSSDGRVKQRFTEDAGDIREPAWGPIVNK
jgi:TolB protein